MATRTIFLTAVAVFALAACDNGPSAVAGRPAADSRPANGPAYSDAAAGGSSGNAVREDHRNDPVQLVDGKPMWSASRRYSADESARRAFERNGPAFGAGTLQAYVRKAHAFVEHPPKGTLTMTRRNGDTLMYDPGGNVFAVASKTGAPRTMFKPDEGRAYWEQQKAREERAQDRPNRRNRDDDA